MAGVVMKPAKRFENFVIFQRIAEIPFVIPHVSFLTITEFEVASALFHRSLVASPNWPELHLLEATTKTG